MELHTFKKLDGIQVQTGDAAVGKVKDIFFDDKTWAIRYFVVDTGNWLARNRVLVSPIFLEPFSWDAKNVPVRLSLEQLEKCPPIESDKPISRQYESSYFAYYNISPYWHGSGLWGAYHYPHELRRHQYPVESQQVNLQSTPSTKQGDPHLRSAKEIKGYGINAMDGEFGRVHDFIFDTETFTIRYFVIKTIDFFTSRKALVSPRWVSSIDWVQQRIDLSFRMDTIKSAPVYEADEPPSRQLEMETHRHYGQPFYREEGVYREEGKKETEEAYR